MLRLLGISESQEDMIIARRLLFWRRLLPCSLRGLREESDIDTGVQPPYSIVNGDVVGAGFWYKIEYMASLMLV